MKQLDLIFDDEDSIDELDRYLIIHQKIIDIADEVRTDMNLEDWTFEMKYDPDNYENNVAEVTGSIHKEATITIYAYEPETIYRVIAHEMGHCLLGRIVDTQRALIVNYRKVQDALVNRLEEETIDSVVDILQSPPKPYGGD